MDPTGVSFRAVISKVTTTIDGGWKVTLDLSANESEQALALAQLRDQLIQFGAVPYNLVGN
jgi:hypothetical protein